MVKILSPVSSYEAAVGVISAGADEIYCGVIVPGLEYLGLSTRPFWCSLSSYDELGEVVRYAHDRGVQTIITTEFPFMAEIIEKKVRKHVSSCLEKDVDALIATDLGTILVIQDMDLDIPVYASTYLASMNYEAVNFLKRLGMKRIILERHLTVDEIQEIVNRSKGVEIEVFIHGPGCSNINVSCYGCTSIMQLEYSKIDTHFRGNSLATMCQTTFEISEIKGNNKRRIGNAPILDAYTFCSFCLLPILLKTGVSGLKIVGRELPPLYQITVTKAYRELVDLLDQGQMEQFQNKIQDFRTSDVILPGYGLSIDICNQKRCYYSSTR